MGAKAGCARALPALRPAFGLQREETEAVSLLLQVPGDNQGRARGDEGEKGEWVALTVRFLCEATHKSTDKDESCG